jgi:transketolase
MLLYTLLHLTGVKAADPQYEIRGHPPVSLDDIKGFRQLTSRVPRPSRVPLDVGVETTSGPLGQGVASVGMAIGRWAAQH